MMDKQLATKQQRLKTTKISMTFGLKVNLGIPIIVICSKVDLLIRGEKAHYLEANLEFI
jgi:hypothetical protein